MLDDTPSIPRIALGKYHGLAKRCYGVVFFCSPIEIQVAIAGNKKT
jgi:hypothetical protein